MLEVYFHAAIVVVLSKDTSACRLQDHGAGPLILVIGFTVSTDDHQSCFM